MVLVKEIQRQQEEAQSEADTPGGVGQTPGSGGAIGNSMSPKVESETIEYVNEGAK